MPDVLTPYPGYFTKADGMFDFHFLNQPATALMRFYE
jgi:hypothetical protein